MAGTVWNDVNTGREVFSMTHLHPQLHKVEVSGVQAEIEISFGFHVFTDQKQVGKVMSFRGETRHFCQERYEGSKTIVQRILSAIENGEYITAFISKGQGQRYYHLNHHDDFILMEIRKPEGKDNFLRIHVVTAYTLDEWGTVNKGRNLRFRYVLEQRLQGKKIV
ncbi:TPA: hypothetical protein NV783_004426 [Escherichia coli]|jgi:hypothetical protein|uniref:Uncharacterized protein n=5 Tax=Enterobacteriaceae TaxID=543 RepID=A0A8T3UXI4_ECOLX|nr:MULTISPECIES: hypothetical protein [Enterobacterales]EAA1336619.1 hypothetical protein [Salmonella enterica subsp. enterica serovar Typhimurium]EAA4684323.1 hypothetical protein [Salmonella enterica subsp. enterica serovar Sandiego]EAT1031599.1 hypothetical protein [Salmonella enterica]EBH9799249.1 hypothetical protein [Salmonella enterica subsp. enterica serovar 4,[5],12:i:-]EBN3512498.1 hypothetical protein [Salmonella enterica subsp. enterica serovar Montevideo]EBX7694953.1 hypothetical